MFVIHSGAPACHNKNSSTQLSGGIVLEKIVLHWDLDADGRFNFEITPALAERYGWLRDHHVVRDTAAVSAWNGHLEETGDNVVSVFLICGNKPVFREESRPIARRRLRSPRPERRYYRRRSKSDLRVVCRDELYSRTTGATVVQ